MSTLVGESQHIAANASNAAVARELRGLPDSQVCSAQTAPQPDAAETPGGNGSTIIIPRTDLSFPQSAIVGSLGELARLLAKGTEVPEEFYFAAGLTVLGAICGAKLGLKAAVDCEPRLYTVLLGESADVKKSTAMRRTVVFFERQLVAEGVEAMHGVGSAEGLARTLAAKHHVLLCHDELKALMDKSQIEGSVLLSIIASLFEGHRWSNPVKDREKSIEVRDGHLSLLGCCTTETYSRMWTSEAIAIGLPNRLFVVSAERKRKVAWPEQVDSTKLDKLRLRIAGQLSRLPLTLDIRPDARSRWTQWYRALPNSEHAKRLDTIGFRLLSLIALTTNKAEIDLETVETVTSILDYELRIRLLTDPIDADSTVARLEEKIRRVLQSKGPLTNRDLRRHANADREGIWAFNRAIENLRSAGDIVFEGHYVRLPGASLASVVKNVVNT